MFLQASECLNATSNAKLVIGVIANPSDAPVVREFFELFKTPWEWYRHGSTYDIVLCGEGAEEGPFSAKLVVVYGAARSAFDATQQVETLSTPCVEVTDTDKSIPLYGPVVGFQHRGIRVLEARSSRQTVGYVERREDFWIARVGFDLFREIRTLLSQGQPARNAPIPTLDLHIAFLRSVITGCGLPLVEIPPVPGGHSFIVCLTHDLDHALLRKHWFDATMFGFFYRATVASTIKAARGRLPVSRLLTNWGAAARLPFVYVGLAQDFWYSFDRYLELEAGRPSTFFVIPFAGRSGKARNGDAPKARAAAYGVSDIADKVRKLRDSGCEIGLHGIDAWNDRTKAREEARRVSDVSAGPAPGVRMHWLYSDSASPEVLEDAGFSYDSTVGYNETVGYRAGTSQVFKPVSATRLLELPLSIMDTALFYPAYLGLSDDEAWVWLQPLMDNAMRFGGVLTVNWHDRSIAPERLWGAFYTRLLAELTRRGAMFCTASQAVSWFQIRRSVVFRSSPDGGLRVNVPADTAEGSPSLRLRVYRPAAIGEKIGMFQENFSDTLLTSDTEFLTGIVESKSLD